jgi:hypothetical protein
MSASMLSRETKEESAVYNSGKKACRDSLTALRVSMLLFDVGDTLLQAICVKSSEGRLRDEIFDSQGRSLGAR